jgi:outer membrane autotransporter protein
LTVEDNSSDSLLANLGARAAYQWNCDRIVLRPELQLAWQHEFLDDNRAIDSRLASGAGNIFTVHSPTFGRDSLAVNAVFTVQWTPKFATFAGFQGNFLAENFTAEGGNLGVSLGF